MKVLIHLGPGTVTGGCHLQERSLPAVCSSQKSISTGTLFMKLSPPLSWTQNKNANFFHVSSPFPQLVYFIVLCSSSRFLAAKCRNKEKQCIKATFCPDLQSCLSKWGTEWRGSRLPNSPKQWNPNRSPPKLQIIVLPGIL